MSWWDSAPVVENVTAASPPTGGGGKWWDSAPVVESQAEGTSGSTRKWSDVPMEALRNIPKSAGEFATALVQPILHPVDTANAIADIAQGAASRAMGPERTSQEDAQRAVQRLTEFDRLTQGMDPDKPVIVEGYGRVVPSVARERLAKTAANATEFASTAPEGEAAGVAERNASREESEKKWGAVADFVAKRYGTEEGFKEAVATDPIGVLADFSTLLTGAGGVAARAPMLTGRAAEVVGRAGQAIGSVGSAIDPLAATVRGVGAVGRGVVEPIVSHGLGFTTGAGAESVRMAGRAGREGGEIAEAFTANMRGAPVKDVVDRARAALDEVRSDRSDAYKKGMAEVGKDMTVLDFQPIEDALIKASEIGDYKGQVINRSARQTMDEMWDIIGNWQGLDPKEFHTIEGLDALKRTVGDVRQATEYGTPARVAADRVYNAIKSEIVKADPEYAKVMQGYEAASKEIGEVTKTFSLREQATGDTSARKLLSATRNNVQTNYGERQRLLDILAARDPTLPAAIAGQAMNALLPRGIVARGGVAMAAPTVFASLGNAAALPAFSPRVVGEAVYLGGRAIGTVDEFADAFGITADRVRAVGQGTFQAGRAAEEAIASVQDSVAETEKLLRSR